MTSKICPVVLSIQLYQQCSYSAFSPFAAFQWPWFVFGTVPMLVDHFSWWIFIFYLSIWFVSNTDENPFRTSTLTLACSLCGNLMYSPFFSGEGNRVTLWLVHCDKVKNEFLKKFMNENTEDVSADSKNSINWSLFLLRLIFSGWKFNRNKN